jgi:catechol 2,3-dioxygenase-like lactoylglutathione lyase family enzyme
VELDSVQIGAADPDEAEAAYALVLGLEPVRLDGGVRRFQLDRGAVEIEPDEPGVHSVRFVGEPAGGWPESFHGLRVLMVQDPMPAPPGAGVSIDHVVVRTPDADRAIALWRDRLGLRLAFDRVFPERGLRLVFFRSGGMTLEFATSDPPPSDREVPDRLYGVSYRVPDLEERRDRLARAGIDVEPDASRDAARDVGRHRPLRHRGRADPAASGARVTDVPRSFGLVGPPPRPGARPGVSVIRPALLVGEYPTPEDAAWLREEQGVTVIVSLQDDADLASKGLRLAALERAYREQGLGFHRIPVPDGDDENLAARLDEIVALLDRLVESGERVYLHCNAGLNRAPTAAIAYLAVREGLPLDAARDAVKQHRHCVPYMRALQMYFRAR